MPSYMQLTHSILQCPWTSLTSHRTIGLSPVPEAPHNALYHNSRPDIQRPRPKRKPFCKDYNKQKPLIDNVCFLLWMYHIDFRPMSRLKMNVQEFFLEETFTAETARPLAGAILLFDGLLRCKDVPQRMERTLEW